MMCDDKFVRQTQDFLPPESRAHRDMVYCRIVIRYNVSKRFHNKTEVDAAISHPMRTFNFFCNDPSITAKSSR